MSARLNTRRGSPFAATYFGNSVSLICAISPTQSAWSARATAAIDCFFSLLVSRMRCDASSP